MEYKAFILAIAFIAAILIAGCQGIQDSLAPQRAGETYNIEIQGFEFLPKEIIISKGDTIVWRNRDSATHVLVSDSGDEISSPDLNEGGKYSHTFESAGTFAYHCSIHPSMKGTIVVR